MNTFQIHLNKKGCSGRAVRYRILSTTELDANEVAAAKGLDKEATRAEYNIEVRRLGLSMMVTEFTPPDTKEPSTAKWSKADPGILDTQWATIFGTRDTGILKQVFEMEHGVSQAEVEDILSGKVSVSED